MSTATATPDQLRTVADRARNVGEMFFRRVELTPEREAFRYPDAADVWHSLTWAEAGTCVRRLAGGLLSLGIEPEQRVAIAAATRYEWILADLAVNAAGGATTTVYPSTIAEDVAYILADSGSRIVFAEDDAQVAKLRSRRSELPDVAWVVTFDGATDGEWVIGLEDLARLGDAYLGEHPDAVDERVAGTTPESLATLIYTSGTTGRPKGVRLSHDAWTYEGAAVDSHGILSVEDLEFLWLPLAHSFGKVLLMTQLQIGFAAAVDGRVPRIVDNLAVVRPTFMGAAPRIFEKAYGRIVSMMEDEGGLRLKLFRWAEGVALRRSRLVRAGDAVPAPVAVQFALADRLVLAKIRARFGSRVRFFISGSAALSSEVAEWFHAVGMPVLEGYGLTETSAGTFVNHPDSLHIGTVGPPLPGTAVRIAEDGEVLVKGPGVMLGYHNLDAETATALVDGWLATGDIGHLDEHGHLVITDRKKDLFKTSGGKYVAPSRIEGLFKGISPLASQMIVHGDQRRFCSALITLDPDAVAAWAASHGHAGEDYATVVASDDVHRVVAGHVEQLNARLNQWETIKKWAILPADLSIEHGEITPSLKVKRKVVEQRYADVLEGFYA